MYTAFLLQPFQKLHPPSGELKREVENAQLNTMFEEEDRGLHLIVAPRTRRRLACKLKWDLDALAMCLQILENSLQAV